jgi:hypothetical protein
MYAGVPTALPAAVMRLVASPGGSRTAQRFGHAEVGHECVAIAQQDVFGLDVTVDHAASVGVRERVQHVAQNAKGFWDRQLAGASQPLAKRLALDVRHHVKRERRSTRPNR